VSFRGEQLGHGLLLGESGIVKDSVVEFSCT
jgi:hypothetical protein